MATKKITFDTVREMGMRFPGVEYGTAYGAPALKVHGRCSRVFPLTGRQSPTRLPFVSTSINVTS
jgi:hypothetical protein